MTIVKRTGLGRPLTWSELDNNWDQLQESTSAAQQSAALAAASQSAAATSEFNAATSAASAAVAADAVSQLRSDLASTDTGKGLSLLSSTDGQTGQQFYNQADQFAGDYSASLITITSANRWITYNGERWYVKPTVKTPFTTTGLNATSWVVDSANFTNLSNDLSSDADGKGDSLVAVKQPFTNSVSRTQHDKNTDLPSVADFGIIGDGSNEDAKWIAMIASVGKTPVIVPHGSYTLFSEIPADGLSLVCMGASFVGAGYLQMAKITGTSLEGVPFVDFGNKTGSQQTLWGDLFSVGGAPDVGASGMRIGGANPRFGSEGMTFYLDGYPGWLVSQPSKWPSSAEYALMPSSRAGRCSFTSGSNVFTIESGANLLTEDIGQVVWVKDIAYVVTGVSGNTFTTNNAASSTGKETYTCTYNSGSGKCNVSGKDITVTYGDPITFVVPCPVVINGVSTKIVSFVDTRHAVLADDLGSLTDVSFRWTNTVDDLAAAFRLHRISGAGYEENISLIAYNKGYYHMHAGSGGPSQLPFYMGSGWDSDGAARKSITVDGSGLVVLGGKYGSGSMEFGYREEKTGTVNRFRVDSSTSGDSPSLSTTGADTNINMTLRPKGNGGVVLRGGFTSVNSILYPETDNSYTMGTASNRWSTLYAGSGVINTSDARAKNLAEDGVSAISLNDSEVKAATLLAAEIGKYTFKHAQAEKGDDARQHIGMSVQKAISILESCGLVATDYSFICYDKWDDEYENQTLVKPAGDLYSFRMTDLLSFICAGINHTLLKFENRLSNLESKHEK